MRALIPAAAAALILAAGDGSAQSPAAAVGLDAPVMRAGDVVERETYVMGTRLAARLTGPAAASAAESAFEAARALDLMLSTWREDSELAAVNRAPAGLRAPLSEPLARALAEVAPWVEATGGAFDPAVGSLVQAWDLRGEGRVPSAGALERARASAGWSRVRLDAAGRGLIRRVEGVELDAGAWGKGLALRQAATALRQRGVTGVLNFGGQVQVVGGPVTVRVADPARRDGGTLELRVSDASVATTSLSERFVEEEGRRYGHVIDPRTGHPVEAWGSVTVVAEDALVADILSTALFVMGPEAALEWAAEREYGVLVQESTESGGGSRWNRAMERWLETRSPAVSPRSAEPPASRPSAAAAQDTTELERLKRQVEAITRELERMRLGSDVVERADTGVLGFGPAASKVYGVAEGVSLGGYGEVLYGWQEDELEDGTPSEATNRWDALRAILYVGYKFNDRLLFNSEIEIEHASEAFLEFAYLDYRLSEAFGLRAGLLLAPVGLVNELHEPPVFLGSTRPLVEQQIIPTTWRENGFGVFGGLGSFSYRAYLMNGLNAAGFSAAGLRGGRQKGIQALAEDVAGVVRVDYEGVLGLLVGGSVYHGGSGQGLTVSADPGAEQVEATTTIAEAHASYMARGLDLRALVARASLDDAAELNQALGLTGAASVGERMGGGYAHAGYDVLRAFDTAHQLFPYVRYEWVDTQKEVPAGYTTNPATDRTAVVVGASWKPVPNVAIKGDYQVHGNEAETGRSGFFLAVSYLF